MRACVSRSAHMCRIGKACEIQVAGCAYESFSLGRPCRRQRIPSGLKLAVRRYCADGQGAERNAQIAKRKAQRSSKQSLKQAASEVVSVPLGLQRGATSQAGR